MAVWCTCYQVGGIAATALAAWSLRFGFRAVFYVPAAVLAAVGVLVLALLKAGPSAPDVEDARARSASDVEAERAARRAALRSPILWSFGASYFAIKLIRYSLLFWLPYYLADSLGYAEGQAGYTSVAFEVGGTIGVIGIGFFTHRFQSLSRAALSAVTLVGLTLALVLYTRIAPLGVAANALGLALIGFCLFGPDSVISGAAAQDAGGPLAAATAAGLVNGVGSVGAIIQGWLNGWVSRTYGWQAVFTTLIVLAFLGALALIPAALHERTKPLQNTSPP
jgi:sugar phosphate permease